mmetsp:Transcript_8318/g.24719  ORF Transcript_8318/g.24719 Transcript_8318/m.24719 type:complete len:169 (+) Transcript_8318:122-628(+)
MTIGLENRGVTHGVHDFRAHERTREDYHRLMTSTAGDTRNRLFGVEAEHGTFNAGSRAVSLGCSGFHPKSEYKATLKNLDTQDFEHGHGQTVKGGHVQHFVGVAPLNGNGLGSRERARSCGALGRQIVGDCAIKDDAGRFVYYGASGYGKYGLHSKTLNQAHYKPQAP